MSDDSQPEKVWDEYDWERFLQQQEQRTERYMELIEKYMDHPDRDAIIAREMGWTHFMGEESKEWEDEVDAEFEAGLAQGSVVESEHTPFGFEKHPIYRMALAFTSELDEIFDGTPSTVQEHPATITLNSQATLAAAKLAAALNDDDVDEIGMSIAYLKRALKAIHSGLDAVMQLAEGKLIDPDRFGRLRERLFHIRDGIVVIMGDLRSEFRRRHGA